MTDKTPDACRLLARLPNNRQGRAALKTLRANWNREGWRLRVLFSGPRTGWATHKEDAHTFRLYADRTGQTAAEKLAAEHRDDMFKEIYSLREARDQLRIALMGAEENARSAEGAYRMLAEHNAANHANAAHWQTIALRAQSDLNRIPGWILWLVGFAHDWRATWVRFTATRRGA